MMAITWETHLCKLREPSTTDRAAIIAAADNAVRINPANYPQLQHGVAGKLAQAVGGDERLAIALITGKKWPSSGAKLKCWFKESWQEGQPEKVLEFANHWQQTANVEFIRVSDIGSADLRIWEDPGNGYASTVGTDCRLILQSDWTMNLAGFGNVNLQPESEYYRVVEHEFGHALGCTHEHLRLEIIGDIDPQAAYAYFLRTSGWSKEMVDRNVLNPAPPSSLSASVTADRRSVMCYWLPTEILRPGAQPIPGGNRIDDIDRKFMATQYPKAGGPGPGVDGTDEGFLHRMFKDLVDRDITPGEIPYYLNRLKVITRAVLAQEIGNTYEGRRTWIAKGYRQFLGREPDAGGLNTWMRNPSSIIDVWYNLIGSKEYYDKV